jgi:ABC-2 type transport system permease protein
MNRLQIVTSFKKEIWEFNKTLFWVPIIIATLLIIMPIALLLIMDEYQTTQIIVGLVGLQQMTDLDGFAPVVLMTISGLFTPFIIVALLIQLYYFINCLFDERRDLSIYFWRSLPVADSLNVGVKLLTGAVVVPAIFMFAASLTLLVFLLLALLLCTVLTLGYDISIWHFWAHADIISNLAAVWLNLVPYALWMFPVYAWLMLASAFATKAPFLWAMLPVAFVMLVESFLVAYFQLDQHVFANMLWNYFEFTQALLPHNVMAGNGSQLVVFSALATKLSAVPLIMGAGFIYLAYWLRVNRSQA